MLPFRNSRHLALTTPNGLRSVLMAYIHYVVVTFLLNTVYFDFV